MQSLLIEGFLGLYIGLLTGIVPAIVAGVLGFAFKYITGVTLPGLGVVVLAVAIAGVNGGLLGLIDPDIAQSPRLLVALVVVMMLAMYSHAQGDKLGATLPRRFSLRQLGTKTLSGEAIFTVGGLGRVRISPFGDIHNIEGYPPLSPELQTQLRGETWEFPSDLPVEELENRLEDRLLAEYDLAEVEIDIDSNGRAHIAAAPPLGSLSKRVPEGRRGVSIAALLPTGITRGEAVELHFEDRVIEATVISARTEGKANPARPDGGEEPTTPDLAPTAPHTTGGEGRLTVAVTREQAQYIRQQSRARVLVLPKGLGLEYTAISHLRGAGNRFRRITIGETPAHTTIDEVHTTHDVRVLARKPTSPETAMRTGHWQILPPATTSIEPGDVIIATGSHSILRTLEAELA